MNGITLRAERAEDAPAIAALTTRAFETAAHASGTEAFIVERLREAGALSVSLVAVEGGEIVGHVAMSPVAINGEEGRWFGLGPVSVEPGRQRSGIGSFLIRAALQRLREGAAHGCVVLGDPAYYGRFGFTNDPGLSYADVPPAYFQRLVLAGGAPRGVVDYHPAFEG